MAAVGWWWWCLVCVGRHVCGGLVAVITITSDPTYLANIGYTGYLCIHCMHGIHLTSSRLPRHLTTAPLQLVSHTHPGLLPACMDALGAMLLKHTRLLPSPSLAPHQALSRHSLSRGALMGAASGGVPPPIFLLDAYIVVIVMYTGEGAGREGGREWMHRGRLWVWLSVCHTLPVCLAWCTPTPTLVD